MAELILLSLQVTFTIAENKVKEVTKLIRDLGGKVLRRRERTKTAEPIKVDDSKARSRAGNNLCTASAESGEHSGLSRLLISIIKNWVISGLT